MIQHTVKQGMNTTRSNHMRDKCPYHDCNMHVEFTFSQKKPFIADSIKDLAAMKDFDKMREI